MALSHGESIPVNGDLRSRDAWTSHATGSMGRALRPEVSRDLCSAVIPATGKSPEVMTMAWYQERSAEEKLTVLIRYLVRSFPLASILSRQAGDRYHVFVIVPFDGSQEKTLQVETTVFRHRALRVEGFAALLSTLNLRRVFEQADRYDLDWFGRYSGARHAPAYSGASFPKVSRAPAVLTS